MISWPGRRREALGVVVHFAVDAQDTGLNERDVSW